MNENINIEKQTEDTVNAIEQAVEAIPAEVNGKNVALGVGAGVVLGVTVVTGAAMAIRHFANKKKLKEAQEQAAATGVDNVQVAKDDFEESEPEEK
jgi:hypothetical protein